MPVYATELQNLINYYLTLDPSELFEAYLHSSEQDKEAAMLALFSKTDSKSTHAQWLLGKQLKSQLGRIELSPSFKDQLREAAYEAMQTPSSNLTHKLITLNVLKSIENNIVCIPRSLVNACVGSPLSFPLSVLTALVPQLSEQEISQLILTLENSLKDSDEGTRRNAIAALAALAPQLEQAQLTGTFISNLLDCLIDSHWIIRLDAGTALGALAPNLNEAQRNALLIDLQCCLNATPPTIRSAAADVLPALALELAPAQRGEVLIKLQLCLKDKHYEIRWKAARAIGTLAPKLENTKLSTVIMDLQRVLEDQDRDVRSAAACALAALAPKLNIFSRRALLKDLEKLSTRGSEDARYAATLALRSISSNLNQVDRTTLITTPSNGFNNRDKGINNSVTELAPELDPAQYSERLIDFQNSLKSEDWFVCWRAGKALGALYPHVLQWQLFGMAHEFMNQLKALHAKEEDCSSSRKKIIISLKKLIFESIKEMIPYIKSETIVPRLLSCIHKEIRAEALEIQALACETLILLTIQFPEQVNKQLRESDVLVDSLANDISIFIGGLCLREEAQKQPFAFFTPEPEAKLDPAQSEELMTWAKNCI